jgi:hypothetical protein
MASGSHVRTPTYISEQHARSRQRNQHLAQPPIISRSQARHRIPSLLCRKPDSPAPRVRPSRHIVESRRVRIQRGVHKPQRPLPLSQPFLINPRKNRRKQRRRSRRASNKQRAQLPYDGNLVAQCRDVRVAAAGAVVNAAVGVEAGVVDGLVEGIGYGRLREVAGYGEDLVGGVNIAAVDIGEAAAGAEACGGDFVAGFEGGGVLDDGRAHGGYCRCLAFTHKNVFRLTHCMGTWPGIAARKRCCLYRGSCRA